MNWNKLVLVLVFDIIFLQGNYQLLTIPHNFNNIFKMDQCVYDKKVSFFHLIFPSDISLSSITFPRSQKRENAPLESNIYFNFSYLNYGKLIDSGNNYSFHANEVFIKINRFKKYNANINILYNFGYMISSIDTYSSTIVSADFLLSYRDIKKQFIIAFKNFGYIINSYISNTTDLPTLIHLTFLKTYNPIQIQLNYEKRLDIDNETYSLSSKFNFSENIQFYMSTNSNREDLLYGNYIDKLAIATSFGLSYRNKNNIISLGIQNLGAAGYATAVYFEKINL